MLILAFLSLALTGSGILTFLFHRDQSALSKPWVPDPETDLFSQRLLSSDVESYASSLLTNHPLRASGRHVLDGANKRFKLASINWYGASDELFIPGGLDVQHRDVIAQTIRRLGFNSVRLPYADEMVLMNPKIPPHLLAANADLVGLRALDIFAAVVNTLTDAGIAVIINNHITHSTWCCGADPCDGLWYNDHLPQPICRVQQSEDQWIQNWEIIMTPHINNPLVIGADLRNEVRSLWGTLPWDRWASAAERAGNMLLSMNSNWLIVVGGLGSQNFLDGVRNRPVILDVPNRLIYSSHVYSWSGWGSREGRYAKRSYASFVRSMRENWAYLLEENIAPVWVGEFGSPHQPGEGDAHYWKNLMRFLKAVDADFGYWAINPRKPKDEEEETYSLVEDDWQTLILDYRMKDMLDLMKPKRQ
jgi:endoglucanase